VLNSAIEVGIYDEHNSHESVYFLEVIDYDRWWECHESVSSGFVSWVELTANYTSN